MHTGYTNDRSRPNGERPREKGINLDRGLAFSQGIRGALGNAAHDYKRSGIPFQPSKRGAGMGYARSWLFVSPRDAHIRPAAAAGPPCGATRCRSSSARLNAWTADKAPGQRDLYTHGLYLNGDSLASNKCGLRFHTTKPSFVSFAGTTFHRERPIRLYCPNEAEIAGWSAFALVSPKSWLSFRFDRLCDIWDSGLGCAANLRCVRDLCCGRF